MSLYVKVKVNTDSKKEIVVDNGANNFILSLKEKAENNMANNRVLEIVASLYGVRKDDVRIVKGHHHSGKLLLVNK